MTLIKYPEKPILIVDDEAPDLRSYTANLNSVGINNILLCQDERKVMDILKKDDVGIVLLDLGLPHIPGQEILKELVHDYPEIPVIVITGLMDTKLAAECLEIGCWDYLNKSVESDRLITTVKRTIAFTDLKNENLSLAETVLSPDLDKPDAFAEIITQNKDMFNIFNYIEAIVKTKEPILITGETGVGKELIAKAIHMVSGVKGEYVNVDVSALSKTVFEDELCGHVKGAYTGADSAKDGFIKKAENGTLILNEIGELAPEHQLILLRLLQEKEYSPVGKEQYFKSTARIIAITNVDLKQAVQDGTFRRDLFYRLSTHQIHVPPLRNRMGDIPLLVEKFIEVFYEENSKKPPSIEKGLMQYLRSYNYPGNIRELENIMKDTLSTFSGKSLGINDFGRFKSLFKNYTANGASASNLTLKISIQQNYLPSQQDIADVYIAEVLKMTNGNQSKAAQILGISRPTLGRRVREMELTNINYEFQYE